MERPLTSFPRSELLMLLTLLTALGCTMAPATLTPSEMPEPSKLAELEYIQSPAGFYAYVSWLDDETLGVQYSPGFLGALSTRIWRLAVDGRYFDEIELPDHLSCGPQGQNGFEAPSRLPDGRMGYVVGCRTDPSVFEISRFVMALDSKTGEVEQLLDYPLPIFSVGTGGIVWNPAMNLAIMGNGRSFIDEQLSWYTKAGTEPIDVGLAQAYGPSWSPEGDQVAFIGSKEEGSPLTYSNLGLYIMNAEGKVVRLVLEGFHDASGVAWSPQGRWLAFPAAFGEREEERYGLWLFDLELGLVRQIAEGSFGSVSWSEDGQRIAVVQFLGPPLESEDRVAIINVGPLLGK
jgi:hypothetical protein